VNVVEERGMQSADSNPVAPTSGEAHKQRLFEVKSPVKILKPVVSPDVPSSNQNEIAAAFANAAQAFMRVAELMSGKNLGNQPPDTVRGFDARGYGVSLFEAMNEFLVTRAKKGVSPKYYSQLKSVLQSFGTGRAAMALADIERVDVEKWLNGSDWSVRTQRNNLATIKGLFQWCVRRGWIEKDCATWIELGEVISKPIEIHKPVEVSNVLECARVIDLGVMRILAIRYFGGVRSAEALRLREENILLAHGVIEIPATKSKTKRRRIVRITPNLRAWLDLGGVLIPTGDATIRRVIFQSGVKWAHNVTRHTWESYSVAHTENRAKVAKEAGHSESVQIANYDAVALPADAAAFFKIVPEPVPRQIDLKKWGGLRRQKVASEHAKAATAFPVQPTPKRSP
jgi:integrase